VPPGASTLEINGYPLAYSARGSGPTVVFVPGVLTDYRIWGGALAQWESSYRIVAVSPRHFFPEKWQGNGRGLHGALGAKDLDAFIEKQGGPVSSFAPLGHVASRIAKQMRSAISQGATAATGRIEWALNIHR